MSLDAGGATAKHGNHLTVLVRDLNIVNAAVAALVARSAGGRERIAEMSGCDEVDVCSIWTQDDVVYSTL